MQTLKEKFNSFVSFLKKRKLTKGFSLIELLVVVGIMGLLAAVAIPAYNGYRKTAKTGVVTGTLSQIRKAFPACLSVNTFKSCTKTGTGLTTDDPTIMGTIPASPGSTITSAGNDQRYCYQVELDDDDEGFTGCIDFMNDNTGIHTGQIVGRPVGTICDDIDLSLSCDGTTTTLGHDCPSNDGCTWAAGTKRTCVAGNNNVMAGATGTEPTCTGTSTGAQETQCTTGGVCKRTQ